MWRYIIKRVLASIPVIIIVGVITFSLLYIGPGDPAAIIGGDEANPEILEQIRKDLGFDRPYHVQLGNWAWNMLRGDLGTSIFSKREIDRAGPRIEQIRKMDLIGREMAGAIADIERAIAIAAAHTF